jgi:hypothetical protein
MRQSRHPASILVRIALVCAGLAVAFFGAYALHDGEAALGIPGRNLQQASQVAQVNSLPEVLITAIVFSIFSILLVLAGASPRLFSRTPIVQVLVGLAFVLLVCIPILTSGR